MAFLASVLALIFMLLAGLHAFWAGGGQWGAAAAVPKRPDGKPLWVPGAVACLVVAAGLAGFAGACLAHAGLVRWPLPWPSSQTMLWGMAAIFALRTVGDFRFFGVTRRVTDTDFARRDRTCYTPLCAGLAGALAVLAAS